MQLKDSSLDAFIELFEKKGKKETRVTVLIFTLRAKEMVLIYICFLCKRDKNQLRHWQMAHT